MTDAASLVMQMDTTDAVAAVVNLDKASAAADRAEGASSRLGSGWDKQAEAAKRASSATEPIASQTDKQRAAMERLQREGDRFVNSLQNQAIATQKTRGQIAELETGWKQLSAAQREAATNAVTVIRAHEQQTEALRKNKEALKQYEDAKKSAMTAARAFAAAALVVVAAVVVAAKSVLDYNDRLKDMSEATGIGAQSFGGLAFGAQQSGVSMQKLGLLLGTMSDRVQNAAQGNKTAAATFEAMGIKIKDASGNIKGQEEILKAVADKFSGYADGTEKAALAQEIFGRGGRALIPFLNQGAAGIEALKQKYIELGGATDEQAARANTFNDQLDVMAMRSQNLTGKFVDGLIPAMSAIVKVFLDGGTNASLFQQAGIFVGEVLLHIAAVAIEAAGRVKQFYTILIGYSEAWQKIWKENSWKAGEAVFAKMREDIASIGVEAEKSIKKLQSLSGAMSAAVRFGDSNRDALDRKFGLNSDSVRGERAPVPDKPGGGGRRGLSDAEKEANKAIADFLRDYDKYVDLVEAATDSNWKYEESVRMVTKRSKEMGGSQKELDIVLEHLRVTMDKTYLAAKKLSDERAKEAKKAADDIVQGIEKEVEALEKKAQAIEDEVANFGRTKAELEDIIIKRKEEALAYHQQYSASYELVKALEAEIETRKRLRSAQGELDVKNEQKKINDKARKDELAATEKMYEEVDRIAADAFNSIGEKGTNIFKSLAETFKKTVMAAIYQMSIRPIVLQIVGSITGQPAPTQLLGGGGGNFLTQLLGGGNATAAGGAAPAVPTSGGSFDFLSGLQNLFGGGPNSISSTFSEMRNWFSGGSNSSGGGLGAGGGAWDGGASQSGLLSPGMGAGGGAWDGGASQAGAAAGMGGLASVVGNAGIGYGIGTVAHSLFGNERNKTGMQVGGTVGAVVGGMSAAAIGAYIGTAIFPILGTVIGALIGALVGSFIKSGGGDKVLASASTAIDIRSGKRTPGSAERFFTSDKDTSKQDQALLETVQEIGSGYRDLARSLGIKSGSAEFSIGFDADPKGTAPSRVSAGASINGQSVYSQRDIDVGRDNDDLQARMELELKRALFAALQASFADDETSGYLKRLFGEMSAATASAEDIDKVIKTAQAMKLAVDTVSNSMSQVGEKLRELSPENIYAMIEAFGGLDEFAAAFQFLNENFLTNAQKMADANKFLEKSFTDLGYSVPATHAAFLAMVEGLDLTTDAGRETYASLMALAPAFVAVKGSAEQVAQFFQNSFLTNAQKQASNNNVLAQSFAAINLAVPRTHEEFIRLLGSFDQTTTDGKKAYDSVMGLSGAFVTVMGTAEQATAALLQQANAGQQAFESGFYSQGEQLQQRQAVATQQVQSVSEILGFDVPTTKAAFRAMGEEIARVNGITSETYQRFIALAPAVLTLNESISDSVQVFEEASTRISELFSESAAGAASFESALSSLVGELAGDSGDKIAAQMVITAQKMTEARKWLADNADWQFNPYNAAFFAVRQKELADLSAVNDGQAKQLARFTVLKAQHGAQMAQQLFDLEAWYAGQAAALRTYTSTGDNSELLPLLDKIFQEKWAAIIKGTGDGIDKTLSELDRLRKGILDYVDKLKLGSLSVLTPEQKFLEAQKQYDSTLSKAKGGDTEAMGKITEASDAFLTIARDMFASSSRYTAIFDQIVGQLTELGTPPATGNAASDPQQTIANALPANGARLASADDVRALGAQFTEVITSLANANTADANRVTGAVQTQTRELVDATTNANYSR